MVMWYRADQVDLNVAARHGTTKIVIQIAQLISEPGQVKDPCPYNDFLHARLVLTVKGINWGRLITAQTVGTIDE